MLIRKTLKLSIISGILNQVYSTLSGSGSAFLTKFMVMLNATPMQFAILSSISTISQLFQPFGVLITKKLKKRKNVLLFFQFLGCSISLFYGVLPFINLPDYKINIFLSLFFLSVSILSISGNIWIGWITDIVPLRFRGRFFSIISQFAMVTAILSGYIFSLFLDYFEKFGLLNLSKGFLIIFSISVLFSFLALFYLSKIPEKEKNIEKENNLKLFFSPLYDKNYRKFVLYNCWWMLAIGIGAPFWQPFMLKKLHMSLFEIQIYNSINIIFSILIIRFWGKTIDKYGNKTAMRFIILLGGLNPIVWLFVNPQNYYILYIEAITSGIMWAGAGLVSTNFVLSISPPDKRQIYSGLSGAFAGIFMMSTMLLSGLFIQTVKTINLANLEPEQILFGCSGIARWSAIIPLTLIFEKHSRPIIKLSI